MEGFASGAMEGGKGHSKQREEYFCESAAVLEVGTMVGGVHYWQPTEGSGKLVGSAYSWLCWPV